MLTVLVVIAVLLVLFFAAVVATSDEDVLVEAPADAADLDLPIGPLQPEDVADIRFGMVVRGYRMSEVDEVLARVTIELAKRDSRITQLEQALVDVVEPALATVERQLAAAELPPLPSAPVPVPVEAPLPEEPVAPADPPPPREEAWSPASTTLTAWPPRHDLKWSTDATASSPELVHAPLDFPEVLTPEPAAPDLAEATEPPPERQHSEIELLASEQVAVPEAAAPELPEPPLGHPGEGYATSSGDHEPEV